jgi:hypothetical protein
LPELLGVVAGMQGAMLPSNLISKIVAEIKVLSTDS